MRAWVGEISVSKEVVLQFFLQYLHLLGALNASCGVQDIFRIDIVPGLIEYNQPISGYFQGTVLVGRVKRHLQASEKAFLLYRISLLATDAALKPRKRAVTKNPWKGWEYGWFIG